MRYLRPTLAGVTEGELRSMTKMDLAEMSVAVGRLMGVGVMAKALVSSGSRSNAVLAFDRKGLITFPNPLCASLMG